MLVCVNSLERCKKVVACKFLENAEEKVWVRFSQKATKIWCNLTEGLDITVEFGDKELFVHRKIIH